MKMDVAYLHCQHLKYTNIQSWLIHKKGYGSLKIQYALWESLIGSSHPVTNIGQGGGPG